MKHSVDELVAIAHQFFPKGMPGSDPRYSETPEVQRQFAARIPASARYGDWCALLSRLRARFPERDFPGVEVQNLSLFLRVPTAAVYLDRCFSADLLLPVRAPSDEPSRLRFYVSFVVPYYTIFHEIDPPLGRPKSASDLISKRTFDISPEVLPYSTAIAEEIETTFPGYAPISPAIGQAIVPDVVTGTTWFGDATIFNCLFSDHW